MKIRNIRSKSVFDRREFLPLAGVGVAGLFFSKNVLTMGRPASAKRKPNIIVIIADDLGYAELGVQGCKDIPTPNIDSIARNGVRFTAGYVTCPICSPSRAALITGHYQQRFGHETNGGPGTDDNPNFGLDKNETTLAKRLKDLGYITGIVGKWHLGYKSDFYPMVRGFDEFFGFLGFATTYFPNKRAKNKPNPILRGTTPVEETEYLTDVFAREAVDFINRHSKEPFFLYLSFNAVHGPLQAADKYLQRFENIQDERRRTFAAMNSAMDDAVGNVLVKLKELNLEDNTLIFFISDNGGNTNKTSCSNAPLKGFKGQVWEGGIRIPFLVQWKGHLPAGKVYEKPVSSLDIFPTSIIAAGGKISPQWKLDGVDMLPYLSGSKSGLPHKTLYWRMGVQHAVRDGDWKLVVVGSEGKPQLYNLDKDIGETTNVADQNSEKVKELMELYDKWNAQMQPARW